MKRSTLVEVAKAAKVSIGTTSRVINNHPNVSPEARAAVEEAIRELDFTPSLAARSLRRGGSHQSKLWTGNIGLVLLGSGKSMRTTQAIADVICGAQSKSSEMGYNLLISTVEASDTKIPNIIRDQKVEGVIIHSVRTALVSRAVFDGVPAIQIGLQRPGMTSTINVAVDNQGAIGDAVARLYEIGHRRIGFVARDVNHDDFYERLQGYRRALRCYGNLETYESVKALDPLKSETPDIEPPNMDDLVFPLLDRKDPVTAIIAANDWMAVGVYASLHKRSLQIPQDISVVGFDNYENVCGMLKPSLTSMSYPGEAIGYKAADLLLKKIKNDKVQNDVQTILIASKMYWRNSTGPVKATAIRPS